MTKILAGSGFLVLSFFLALPLTRLFPYRQGASSTKPKTGITREIVDSAFQQMADEFLLTIDSLYQQDPVPGLAIAIVRDGEVVENRVWGYSNLSTRRKLDTTSVFRLASVSKGFAPFVVGKLVDRGFLHWDHPVKRYVPSLQLSSPEATEQLSIRHLLSHTTGLPRHTFSNLLDQEKDIRLIQSKLKEVPLRNRPGTQYDYQNVAYGLLADVVESVTKRPYDHLLYDWVFKPAGMRTSSGSYAALMKSPDIAYPHSRGRYGYVSTSPSSRYYAVGPAAGVNASIGDMARWMQTLQTRSGQLVSDSTLREIFRPQIDICTCEATFQAWQGKLQRASYGFGWRIIDFNEDRLYYHGGNVNNYRSEIALDPMRKVGITALQNSNGGFISQIIPLFWERLQAKIPRHGARS